MGFLRNVGVFGAAFVGVVGGHMLIASIMGGRRQPQSAPPPPQQQQTVQDLPPIEMLKYADFRSKGSGFDSQQDSGRFK